MSGIDCIKVLTGTTQVNVVRVVTVAVVSPQGTNVVDPGGQSTTVVVAVAWLWGCVFSLEGFVASPVSAGVVALASLGLASSVSAGVVALPGAGPSFEVSWSPEQVGQIVTVFISDSVMVDLS